MQETEDNSKPSYDVIQFLELPNENIEKYTVIPHSWIRIILPTEGTVTVAYPEEDEGKTYKRVKNKKKFKKHWKRYPAVVKYEAYTFEEAQCWKSVATLGNSNIYDHVIETKMDHYGNCSDADNSIEDDYTDDDCIILTKEEPLDIHDNFADVVSQLNGENVDNGNASMNDDEQLDFEESFSAAENLIAPLIDDLEDNVTSPINDEQIGYNESFSAADNLIASVTDDLEDNVTSPINDEQIRYNENFSAAENLIAPLTDDLKDNVTSPINDEQIGYNDDYDDADSFVPQINTDEAGTSIAHTDENNKDDCVAPIHKNDTNKHAAISNNNYADNFFTPKHNNDDVHVIPVRGNSANDCVTPTNNTDIDNCAAVNNCIYDCVPPVHNNKAFDYIALEHNNNTDDCVSSGHNDNAINCVAPKSNICTNCDAAPNNCNHKSDNVAPSNDNDSGDHGGNNHIAPMSNDENTYKNDSPQSMLNAVATTSTTNNLIQTGRPRSVFLEPSKSTPKKTRTTMCCDCPPPNTITKPQMTVMPRINTQNELAPSKSVIECTKKKQLINHDKEISNRVKFINHLINSNMNLKETYPILQDNSLQPLNLEKNVTSRVNNACHQQAYPQGLSNAANMSFNPSENRNSFQKHTSRVSMNDWAQDHMNPSFFSPSVESTRKMTYFNSIQDNMTSANENCRPIQPEAVNKQPVTLLENGLRAESVRPNLAHNIVTQMNHIDQTPYSQNATNTASTQHLTKYPTYGNSNSGQQMTSALANEHFALAKRKFSLASVQHSELYRHDYNNLPVTLHENDSSMEPIRAKIIDYSVNQKNRLDEKAHSSNVKNTATIEYSTHRNLNSGQQMTSTNVILRHANELPKYSTHSTVQPTTMHEPPQSNNTISTHRKKTQRNSPKQSQQNSSNYTFSVQPAQIIISDSTGQVPQNIANNQPSPLQNSFSAASQHWIPHAAQRHMPYEPRATQIPVGKPMESNSIYSQYGIQHNMMGQPSVMRNPGHSDTNMQVSPFIRPLNSNLFAHNTPTIFTNSSQGLHRKGGGTQYQDYTQGAISTIADSMYRGPCLEGYVNTGAHAVPNFVNRAVPYSEHTSIDRAHVIQDTNGLIFTKPPNAYPFEQRTSIQSTSMNNIPLGFQQYPAANQLNQYSGRFNEQRTAPVYENNLIHETHMQNTNTKRPAAVNTHSFNPQSYHQFMKYSQNIESLVQTNQYPCANKCCNPNVVKSTVVQNHPQIKQNQNVEFSTENALNSTNQSSLEENQLATQQQNSSSRKQHTCTEPGNCETNDTAKQPEIKQNKISSEMIQSLTNQAKAYKKNHVNSSDERMSTEFNTIEQSNNTKECDPKHSKNRQSYEKTDRISSISSNSSDEEISINEITVEKINNAKNKVQSIEPKNSNCLLDDCTQQSRVLDRRTSLKEIKTHLKKMKSRSSKTYSIFQTRFDSYTGDIDIWKKLKERINVYVDRKIKESSSKLQIQNKNKGEVQNLCLYDDQSSGDDSDDDSDDYQEPPQKKPFLQKKSIQMTQSGY